MPSFKALEDLHMRSPIRAKAIGDVYANGVLTLDRERTEIMLASETHLHFFEDENGWSDIHVIDSQGDAILLKNALILGTGGSYRQDQEAHTTRIYPNIVIFNSASVAKDGLVSGVTFSFSGLKDFFSYAFIEQRRLEELDSDQKKLLRKLSTKKKSELYRPVELFLVHLPKKELFQFKYEGNRYSLHYSYHHASPFSGIAFDTNLHFSITFSIPKTIDDALDEAWYLKRFFEQVAFKNFDFDEISVRSKSKTKSRYGWSPIYLPGISDEVTKVHPGEIILNKWSDKTRFIDSMKGWIAKESERKLFRSTVSFVLKRSKRSKSVEDILLLCSAIESLGEKHEPLYSVETTEVLIRGALQAASENNIDIDAERVRALLLMIRQQSLPNKLSAFLNNLTSYITPQSSKLLLKIIHRLRNASAHGGALSYSTSPLLSPAIQALMGCCILYDLHTSGMPLKDNDWSLTALRRTKEALEVLHRISGK